jgi:hypothetical protein
VPELTEDLHSFIESGITPVTIDDVRARSGQHRVSLDRPTVRRWHRWRGGLAVGGGALVASGVATVLLVLAGPGTTNAFAGWTASPTTPAPGQVAAAEATCEARPTNPPPAAPTLPSTLTLSDTRGPFTLLLFGANTTSQGALMCMSGPDGTQFSIASGSQPALPGSGQITLDRLQGASANAQSYTIAEGSTGSQVSAATLVLSDGTRVATTIGNGLLLAWWPGSVTVTSASLTTPSGATTQPVSSPTIDSGGSGATSASGGTNSGNGNGPHTASQRAELQRFCAQLKAESVHGPNGQPIGPCASLAP